LDGTISPSDERVYPRLAGIVERRSGQGNRVTVPPAED
jgi:hypothetical protein